MLAGFHHGYFSPDGERCIAEEIIRSEASLVLVGMGQPRQELWAARWTEKVPAPVLCVGALIDRMAGVVSRAPLIMRKTGTEWLYRLMLEPHRLLKRYSVGVMKFFLIIGAQKINIRRTAKSQQSQFFISDQSGL